MGLVKMILNSTQDSLLYLFYNRNYLLQECENLAAKMWRRLNVQRDWR